MSRKQLTAKQHEFLEFLAKYVRRNRVWPTYREIVDRFGYRSPNSVTQNLQALEKKGYLARDENGYRLAGEKAGLPRGLPVHGEITGGDFELAVDMEEVTLRDLFPTLANVYAVRLQQNINGIDAEAGDYVLVDSTAGEGEASVVMIEGEAAVCHVTSLDGTRQIHFTDGTSRTVRADDPAIKVIGRYAGHINRSGLYRSPAWPTAEGRLAPGAMAGQG